MTQEEFLGQIRSADGLRRAVLRAVEIDRSARECVFDLVTDTPYTAEDEQAAERAVRAAVPASMQARVQLHKLVADPSLVRSKILEYLSHSHRAASACIRAEDVEVVLGDPVKFVFGVDGAERGFFEKNEQLLPGVKAMLERNFCNKFEGSLADKVKEIKEEEET